MTDPEAAQARILRDELEGCASRTEEHITALEQSARARVECTALRLRDTARLRRLELYEIRRQIDAIDRRFGVHVDGDRSV